MGIVDVLSKIAGAHNPAPSISERIETPPVETLKKLMEEEFRSFAYWVPGAYETLPEPDRRSLLSQIQTLEEQINQAYRENNWAAFQSALAQARAAVSEAQNRHTEPQFSDKHWIYRAWSRILDAEVWFVCCNQEVAKLTTRGIERGSIYTALELMTLLKPTDPNPDTLRSLHFAKVFFGATVVRVKEDKLDNQCRNNPQKE